MSAPDLPGAVGITALRVYPWDAEDGLCGGSPHVHLHRAVNDGDLQVVVVMRNSGLPEAGDAVLTFPRSTWRIGSLRARGRRADASGHGPGATSR